jgi:NADH:ubiquinone oxidoreductase subunit F (NADH-binding)/NADH:ubiquinone oxidoreductase subunit E
MIIAELTRVQERDGWVSADAAHEVAGRLGVPLHRVEGVLSFYPRFRRSPPPRLEVALCRDMSCFLRGGADLGARVRAQAGGAADVEVREVSCLGRCEAAPAMAVNHVPSGALSEEQVAALVAGRQPPPDDEHDPLPPPRPWRLAQAWAGAPAPDFDAERVLAALRDAGLRGMGGAGFPTAQKWELVARAAGARKYVVCNADESEPGTFKDRVILEEMPELVLDGMWLAARTVGAERAIVYLRHEYHRAERALRAALAARGAASREGSAPCPTEIFVSPGGYVMGDETALLEALEDRRGEPRNKPPFPGTHGLHGMPTLINNVETLAAAAAIWRRGAAWWKGLGVRGASGLKMMSVSGHVARPDTYEIPMGTTVAELLALAGGVTGKLRVFAPGGASSNFLPPDKLETPIDFAPLQAAGSMLGSGALVVVAEGADVRALSANVLAFFRNESCGKCVPCRVGTEKALAILQDPRGDLGALDELEEAMRLTSICGLGQVALGPSLSLRRFHD